MKWFEGQISSAIAQARQQKSVFMVYIRGSNEDSQKMDATWEEDAVNKTCQESGIVVMRFQADSEECKQFSVYYPVICVPCVYLISGETGVLIESIGGFASAPDLVQKIKKVYETVKQNQSASTPPEQPAAAPQVAAATPPPVPQPSATPVQQSSQPEVPSTSSSSGAQKESAQERAARMRQKMEEVHRKKEQQRKEAEKQKELERRKVGQEIQKADQHRSELQAKQVADDLRKQRLDDKLAREKVLQQLARDKAEKEVRFRSEKEQREQKKMQAQKEKEETLKATQARQEAAKLDTARIQFRLPDGSTMTNQFDSKAPLQEAQDYVKENVGTTLPEFTLSVTYPRRNFGPDDMQTSFLDLGLAPRAAIVVLPGKLIPTSSKSQVSASNAGGIISWLLAPFLFIYNIIYNVLFGSSESPSGPQPTPPSPSQTHSGMESPAGDRSSRGAGARPKSSYARRRTPASGSNSADFSRREGNVHRLNTQQDEDDENNTWNGNSTQQM
ncbi:LOW QUALITY PROTEIN: UBX domain-containing protein 4-like [Lytechinus variegatus]|uniref:LOW QUALITY PROTEIN: UBX domain-containing protein 4-like n=1 Tax=Lytechinus variegatus TaxID=7654 RepID=UPI001BB2ADF9|nr:LOW QUALITY PROTEIN: UBX domain-containing protein 4-like [Lytechinus variegatus]